MVKRVARRAVKTMKAARVVKRKRVLTGINFTRCKLCSITFILDLGEVEEELGEVEEELGEVEEELGEVEEELGEVEEEPQEVEEEPGEEEVAEVKYRMLTGSECYNKCITCDCVTLL